MDNFNKPTLLMMAAANLYRNDIAEDVKQRLQHPYKAESDENGIDLNAVQLELDESKFRADIVNTLFTIATVIVLFLLLFAPYQLEETVIFAFISITLVEFINHSVSIKRAIKLTRGLSSPTEQTETVSDTGKVVISGGFSPFLGAGLDLDSWSFPINLSLADDENKPVEDIRLADMHMWIKNHISKLGITELQIDEQLFVNGRDVNFLPALLPRGRFTKPESEIDDESLLNVMFGNDKRQRHYTRIRIPMWDSQVTVSMYFRLLRKKDILFIEARFFQLMPLQRKYREIENLPEHTKLSHLAGELILSAIKAPFKCLYATFMTLQFIMGGFVTAGNQKRQWRKELEENRLYNYGWESSLREKWSSKSFEKYFQQIDQDFLLKLLTDEFLSSILSFLELKNISTERFKQTSTKIINEGVMISGGEVKAESLAVGKSANVFKQAVNKVDKSA